LGLSDEESAYIELKIKLTAGSRQRRSLVPDRTVVD
jgi:hypothetical protein